MKKLFHFIVLVLLFTVLFYSCDSDKCSYTSGKETTSILNSDSFKCVAVHGLFDVELVQDTVYFVESIGGKNVVENLEVSVEHDTLMLFNYNGCFWLRDYKRPMLRVHFPHVERIDVFQASYIFSKDSITDNLYLTFQTMMAEADITVSNNSVFTYVHHNTGGKYVFRGKTNNLTIYGFYSALYDASELEAMNVSVLNYSIIDYKVWATGQLNVQIFNRGNVYYKGNPLVIIDSLTSTGNVYRMK